MMAAPRALPKGGGGPVPYPLASVGPCQSFRRAARTYHTQRVACGWVLWIWCRPGSLSIGNSVAIQFVLLLRTFFFFLAGYDLKRTGDKDGCEKTVIAVFLCA